ncbi:oxidoreductase [Streptomyces sp. NPDC088785]|uniref:oxidoreductase n=1 Tax=Streptomyces sp. NPDC088785 TaxID=3365897 RepID=UPI00382F991A
MSAPPAVMRLDPDVLRDRLLEATGTVRIERARITGPLALDGTEIKALVRFEECEFEGPVGLEAASVPALTITRSRLPGLRAPTARFGGRVDLRGTTIDGALDLVHAHIGGGLRLDGARLVRPGGVALEAGGLVMRGGVFCEGGFVSEGLVGFPGAQLPGGLWMRGALITVGEPDRIAFDGDNLTASTLRLSQGFRADGRVRLRGARIEDLLTFNGAELLGPDRTLMCVGARAEALDLRFAVAPRGRVNLRNAHFTRIQDAPRTWPPSLGLDGLTYDWLETTAPRRRDDVANRLAWLRRDEGYCPQPYEQLGLNYRRLGHDDEARRVLLHRQRRRRATLGAASRLWGYLLDATVGYGYRPWLAGLWLALLTAVGCGVFATHRPVPNKPGEGPPFHALVYTLDLLVPIGGFGQRDAWHWDGTGPQTLAYALVVVGWVLTTAVVAGVTRTLSRG